MRKALPAIAVLACLFSCNSKKDNTAAVDEERITVRVRKVHSLERASEVAASGSVEAQDTAKVAFLVTGRVVRVRVQEGDAVRQGQVLAELDPTDYQHGLDAALGQEGMARAGQTKARTGTRKQELEQARVAFERAEDEYNRMKRLFERKSLAPNDFKKFEAAYLVARERYSEAREGARAEDREAADSAVAQARAQVLITRKRLSDTRLTAPIGGVVARRMVDPGDTVAAGYPVFVIMNLNPAQVRVGVPEAEIGRVRLNLTGTVTIPSLAGQAFEGKVSLVGVAADPASRTFSVKIDVPNPRLTLRAGMIAEAHIRTDAKTTAMTVPGDAVVTDPQGATLVYVYFPAQQRVYARRVETGSVYEREVEIRKGLNGDERVVVAGQNRVREGSAVEAQEERP